MDELFRDMQQKGLVDTGDWLEIAVKQKAKNLTVSLAASEPVVLDDVSVYLILKSKENWN